METINYNPNKKNEPGSELTNYEKSNFEGHRARIEAAETLKSMNGPFAAMSVGVPGSGKSKIISIIAELANKDDGIAIINPDSIREEMTGDAADQSKNKEVWEETYKRAGDLLANGVSVIIDATFADKRARRSFIDKCKSYGAASVAAIVVKTDLRIAKDRNNQRRRVVPESVLDNMHMRLLKNPVSKSEGIDEIISISNNAPDPELA